MLFMCEINWQETDFSKCLDIKDKFKVSKSKIAL